MSSEPDSVVAARIEAGKARSQLMGTAQQLQSRLAPKSLAQNAWEGAKSKGADLAEDAVDAVRRRPLAAGGVVAAIALFLAREPLLNLAGRLVGTSEDDDDEAQDEEPPGSDRPTQIHVFPTETVT